MLKGLIIVFMLALAGCATTVQQQDISVTCPNGVSFEKKDYAPRDFPNEIFLEYSCKRSKVYRYDLNGDGINDIVWNFYYDENGEPEAWWILRILEPDGSKVTTWAFLRNIDGAAKIIWQNKEIEKQHRQWLQEIIQSINEELAAQ